MTSIRKSVHFAEPKTPMTDGGVHHDEAARGNIAATTAAITALGDSMSGKKRFARILLRAAAGAGKSYALKRMVEEALADPNCSRVGVTAFANKQVFPLAEGLGRRLGKSRVCLIASTSQANNVPPSLKKAATVVFGLVDLPTQPDVFLMTSHMLEQAGRRIREQLGDPTSQGRTFDVLFIDEAWQLPLHRYRKVEKSAAVVVGVGDVGQLPPIDPGQNPWRGDSIYNPYRAWPSVYEHEPATWSIDLPAVWRPTARQLQLWRALYSDWDELTCVAATDDREVILGKGLRPRSQGVWAKVATGVPTLVEVDGLPESEAADIDLPLMGIVEALLDDLLGVGLELRMSTYSTTGRPKSAMKVASMTTRGDPLIAVLATRNQAVDDAADMVTRLRVKHSLREGQVIASTVDSWQGQTNGITVAIHPLSGASALDDFNSAFGRLAVTCTRATHGLLMISRAGLDGLLQTAPARPGTPLGEPGTRTLPRQNHQRILATFARARAHCADLT